jgi:transposase
MSSSPSPERSSATGPDPAPKPTRRTFPAEYKLRILAEYEAAPEGEKGAILRRERMYHSHILDWRAARDAGALTGLTDARTSARRAKKDPREAELEKLRRANARLEADLARQKTAVEALGKVVALWELLSESADTPRPSNPTSTHASPSSSRHSTRGRRAG